MTPAPLLRLARTAQSHPGKMPGLFRAEVFREASTQCHSGVVEAVRVEVRGLGGRPEVLQATLSQPGRQVTHDVAFSVAASTARSASQAPHAKRIWAGRTCWLLAAA